VVVPPLRQRAEDIPILAAAFLERCLAANNLEPKTLDSKFLESLKKRSWPGNVRELKNTIEKLAIITPGPVIYGDPQESSPDLLAPEPSALNQDFIMSLTFREARAEFERRYLLSQLKAHGHNITQTADAIALDRTTLHKKLKALGFKDWVEGNGH
jgi:two-component system nitrogen regulation response regulator NtrX